MRPLSGFRVLREGRAVLGEAAKTGALLPGLVIVAAWGLLNAALTRLSTGEGDFEAWFPELPPGTFSEIEGFLRDFATAAGALGPLFWWVGISGLLFLASRLFGGSGASFRSVLAVVGVACAPWPVADAAILAATALGLAAPPAIAAALGLLTFALSVGALVWHLWLIVAGVSVAARIGYRSAGATTALAGLGCLTAAVFLFLTLAVLLVGMSGMFG